MSCTALAMEYGRGQLVAALATVELDEDAVPIRFVVEGPPIVERGGSRLRRHEIWSRALRSLSGVLAGRRPPRLPRFCCLQPGFGAFVEKVALELRERAEGSEPTCRPTRWCQSLGERSTPPPSAATSLTFLVRWLIEPTKQFCFRTTSMSPA